MMLKTMPEALPSTTIRSCQAANLVETSIVLRGLKKIFRAKRCWRGRASPSNSFAHGDNNDLGTHGALAAARNFLNGRAGHAGASEHTGFRRPRAMCAWERPNSRYPISVQDECHN